MLLKDIATSFGIGKSGVSKASRRIAKRIDKDKGLKRKINKIERKLCVKNEAGCPIFIKADLIAEGLSPFSPEAVAVRA